MAKKKTQNELKKPVKKLRLTGLLIGLALLGLLVYFKHLFVVALVDKQPIWRLTYIQELQKLAGQQTLDSLIVKKLIVNEAKKQKVTVSDEEIQAEIKKIEEFALAQGTTLDELLTLQNMSRNDLNSDIRLNKFVEKIAGTESAQVQEWLTGLQSQSKVIKWVK